MGQKVSPHGLRVGIIKDWESTWYSDKHYATYVAQDVSIRNTVEKLLKDAALAELKLERTDTLLRVHVYTARPGIVVGKEGAGIKSLKQAIAPLAVNADTEKTVAVEIEVHEVKRAELSAKLVAENIARQIENRASFRVVQKRAIQNTMRAGALGIKTAVSGRLGGADMARTEGYTEGNVPLHTLRADIDYGFAEADTTYGKFGVKVFINKGEVLPGRKEAK